MIQTETERIVTNPDKGFVICAPLTFQEDQIETMEMEGIVGGNEIVRRIVQKAIDIAIGWGAGKVIDEVLESLAIPEEGEGPGSSPPPMMTYDEAYPSYPSPRR